MNPSRKQIAVEFYQRILKLDIIADAWKGLNILVNNQRAIILTDENDDYPEDFLNGSLFWVSKTHDIIEVDTLRADKELLNDYQSN